MHVYYLLTGSATQADVAFYLGGQMDLNYECGAPLPPFPAGLNYEDGAYLTGSEFPLGVGGAHGQCFTFTAKSVGGGDLTCSIVYMGVVLSTDHGSSVYCAAIEP
jgi:hypothetical protein